MSERLTTNEQQKVSIWWSLNRVTGEGFSFCVVTWMILILDVVQLHHVVVRLVFVLYLGPVPAQLLCCGEKAENQGFEKE